MRVSPKEIVQNVGGRENSEHKVRFLALLVKNWKQPNGLVQGALV